MPRTKQSQVQQPKWTEIFADDTDEAAAPDIPALKKRRLEPSPSHASAAARRPNNDFPSFLSTSSDSSVGSNDNVNLPASRWPKTARKRSSPQQLSPRRDGSASAKKWRLQLTKRLSFEKQSSPAATSGGIVQPKGWKTREEMRVIARRHEGTFIQYKVLRRPPDGEWIRDQNYHCNDADMEPRLILPQDLMVQSRFVSKSGNHGGNSYLFLDWKLPGTFLKKRKQHITIFQDTRPKLYTPTSQQQETKGADETAHPMLFLDPELAADEVDMITKFIQDAPAGSSPREFFRNCHDKLLLATPAREARNWDEEESTQMEEEGEEETADNVKRAASEWQEGENVHINDTTMMASEEDEVAPDTTLNNSKCMRVCHFEKALLH